jgi:hypothetical protein
VAAVAAARCSGLRWVTIAAAADTAECLFCVFLVNVCYTWHRTPCQGPSLQNSGPGFRFRNKLILPWI